MKNDWNKDAAIWPLAILILLSAIIPGSASAKTPSGTDDKLAKVVITIDDGKGTELAGGTLKSFVNVASRSDFAKRFKWVEKSDLEADAIPFGKYLLVIAQPGFQEIVRQVIVGKDEVWLSICVQAGTVHLVFEGDSATSPPPPKVVSFRTPTGDMDLADHFHYSKGTNIPYGVYELQLDTPNIAGIGRRVDVYKQDVWVYISLQVYGYGNEPASACTGSVLHVDSTEEPLFVRLLSPGLDLVLDDKVDVTGSTGTFSIHGFIPFGKSLLVVQGKSGILDIRQVTIPSIAPITIDLTRRSHSTN